MESEGRTISRGDAAAYLVSDKFIDDYACFVAYRHGIPVGIVLGEWHREMPEHYYEVRNLYVIPEVRGGKVAPQLLRAAADWAGDEDAPIYITTAGEPRDYYKELGFIPTHNLCVSMLQTVREKLRNIL